MRTNAYRFWFYLHVPRVLFTLPLCHHTQTFPYDLSDRLSSVFPVSMSFFFWLSAPVSLCLYHHIETSVCPGFLHFILVPAQSFYLYPHHPTPPPTLPQPLPHSTHPTLSFSSPTPLSLAPLSNTKCPLSCSQVKKKTPTHPLSPDNREG